MPQIQWVGYDIDKRQVMGTNDTCMIRVTAPLAIEDFEIEIVSLTLNAEELEAVGLASKFSLVNSTEMFTALSGLGFPVGDAVYNQTLISEDQLNITGFLGILSMLGAGDHDLQRRGIPLHADLYRTSDGSRLLRSYRRLHRERKLVAGGSQGNEDPVGKGKKYRLYGI
jgi:hypothetical protein